MRPRIAALAICATALVTVGLGSCRRDNPLEPSCTVAITPASQAFASAGGTGTVTIATAASCAWSAATSAAWVAITSATGGVGPGVVTYTVAPNTADTARAGSVVIGSAVHRVTQDAVGACAYDVAPLSLSFQSAGGSGTVTVSTTPACAWTATALDPWVTIVSGANGQGGGTVTLAVASYVGSTTRTGVVRVAGSDVQVTQAAPGCAFVVSPQSVTLGADGGGATVNVSAPAGCGWSVSTNEPWLSILQGGGQGDGVMRFAASRLASADARVGTVRVAGVDVHVVQSGDVTLCQYSVAPVSFSPCMPAATVHVAIETGASCPWNASANVSWLTVVNGAAGTGAGIIDVSATENYDPPRAGIVMVRWPAPTQGQNVQVAQAGCSYATSRTAFSFSAAGGADTFDVLQESDPIACGGPLQDACVWSATTDASWIAITSPLGTSRGDNPVRFTVAPNGTGVSRTATIRVRDRVVTISQSGT